MSWQRKYDFQPGTPASSSQVDDEFNQLIEAVNQLLEEKASYTGATQSINLNNFAIYNLLAELIRPGANGIVSLPNQSSVIVNSVGGMNIQSGVITKVGILTGVVEDKQSEWVNSTFTAKEAGLYGVRGVLEWASSTLPSNSQVLYLYKNGASYNTAMNIYSANVRYAFGDSYVRLAKGDKLEFYVLQDSGGTQKTLAAARFEVVKLM